jgi:hypothetical protein
MVAFIFAQDAQDAGVALPEGCIGYYPNSSSSGSGVSWKTIFKELKERVASNPLPSGTSPVPPPENIPHPQAGVNCMSFVFGLVGFGQAGVADNVLIRNEDEAKDFLEKSGVLDTTNKHMKSGCASVYFWPMVVNVDGEQEIFDFHWAIKCSSGCVMEKAGCEGDYFLWKSIADLETVANDRGYGFFVEAKLTHPLH